MAEEEKFNDMQILKRRMFAMRNGIIADALRKAGSPFHIIFGLNLPQISDIAAEMTARFDSDEALAAFAERVWRNSTTRESMLVAPMLMPRHIFVIDKAREWISQVPATEVADILCHRLLRHEDYALDLARETYDGASSDMERYTALRLMFNLVYKYPADALVLAREEMARQCPLTLSVATMLADEADFVINR